MVSPFYLDSLIQTSYNKNQMGSFAGMKYHRLLCEGLAANNHNVLVNATVPVSRKTFKKRLWFRKFENANNVSYDYNFFINFWGLRQISIFISSFYSIFNWCLRNKDGYIIFNVLSISSALSVVFVKLLFKNKCIAVVTDIPSFLFSNVFISKFVSFYLFRFDYYIFVTEAMNSLVNKTKVPHLVIEGLVDYSSIKRNFSELESDKNLLLNKDKFNIVYIGQLTLLYGVDKLLDSFNFIDNNDFTLTLYGSGNLVDRIINLSYKDIRIRYGGIIPNSMAIGIEMSADLLINTRPSSEIYTHYSFPSKLIEYMSSGTPVLTSKLSGVSADYNDYLFFLKGNSSEDIAQSILDLYNLSYSDLNLKATKAQDFIFERCNNKLMAKRLENLIKN